MKYAADLFSNAGGVSTSIAEEKRQPTLIEKQSWTLDQKIDHTLGAIEQFYNRYNGKVYISFSGGKDSTVLLHIARRLFPDIKAVFCDTGLEFPEIREFVKRTSNVEIIRPSRSFKSVIEDYGYPVDSKKISMGVSRYRNTDSDLQKDLRLWGGINPSSGKEQCPSIPQRAHYLLDAPFKISEKCCDFLKKAPFYKFEKLSGLKPIIGTMAEESSLRAIEYSKHGCNAFDKKHPQSTPLMFWTEKDIWKYIKRFSVPYSEIYDKGYKRTGCMFCMFGIYQDPDRFDKLQYTHPKQWKYCMNKLGLWLVLDFLGADRTIRSTDSLKIGQLIYVDGEICKVVKIGTEKNFVVEQCEYGWEYDMNIYHDFKILNSSSPRVADPSLTKIYKLDLASAI